MDGESILRSLGWTLPEVVLAGAILAVIVSDLGRLRKLVPLLTLAGLVAAGGVLWSYTAKLPALTAPVEAVFEGAMAVDTYAFFFKLAFLAASFLVAVFSIPAVRSWPTGQGEYFALLLSCTFGMLLMAGANDLLMMYLALEFVSITSYIMAGLLRKNRKSAEASLKYIIYGAGASGFMIYGMSFLYGVTGSLDLAEIGQKAAHVQPTLTLITSVLIMAGFGYKIAAAPFHMWCPDVYEGAPTPVTAFFSVGPKAAGFAMLVRFVHEVYPFEPVEGQFEWRLVLALLAVLTMAVGNFGAIHQQNLKRLLAYSSIAHAGYLLVAFAAFTPEAKSGLLFYLVVYMIMNLGAFLLVLVLEERYGIETVDGCRGLGWRAPQLGILATIFMISLTGLPPMAGFVGKVLVFAPVVESKDGLGIFLVVVAVVFSVVSLYYYMRIVAAMYLVRTRETDESAGARPVGAVYASVLWILAAGTVLLGVWWSPLQALTAKALLD